MMNEDNSNKIDKQEVIEFFQRGVIIILLIIFDIILCELKFIIKIIMSL